MKPASVIEHIRFLSFPLAIVLCILAILQGGGWTWFGLFFFVAVNLAADDFSVDYFFCDSNPRSAYFTAILWSMPLLQLMLLGAALVRVAMPDSILAGLTGNREFGFLEFAGTIATYGIVSGISGVSYAHELIHRPTRVERTLGQLLVTFCMHPSIAIEHVYGHHNYACTERDPTLAPRGMGYWRYLPKSYIGEIISACTIENRRRSHRGQRFFSPGNRFLQGLITQVFLMAGALILAGVSGLLLVVLGGFVGLVMIELGNYITHYGIVREADQPMEPRHSWNAPRFVSTSVLINSPRHSDHHSNASAPYWKLAVPAEAPIYTHGNFVMSVLAMLPPLWMRTMDPLLEEWDKRWATPGELELIRKLRRQ